MHNPDNYLAQVLYTNCRKVFFWSKKDNLGTSTSIFLKNINKKEKKLRTRHTKIGKTV